MKHVAYARSVAAIYDVKRDVASYRASPGRFDVITLPEMRYLAISGHGDPNTAPQYTSALQAIYPVAYALKFASKSEGRDYVVPPLEGLWWADDMGSFTTARDKDLWHWIMMIHAPDWIPQESLADAREIASRKDPTRRVDDVTFVTLTEGLCVQTLHIGPYDAEGPTIARMHDDEIPSRGLAITGRHHEVYLGDPRRSTPGRLRTILRQPVRHA